MKRASTGHESYEHVLMCLICRSLFDDHDHQPKFLPCHHTFCKDCLRQYVAQLGDEIECPSCRKLATIPAAGVSALQTNFYAKYIQSLVYGCVGSSTGWVSDCSRHPGRRLVHFCKDCAISICDLCLQERGCARHRCDLLTTVMEQYRCDIDAAFAETNTLIEKKKVELERLLKLLASEKDDALIKIESTFEQHVHALTRRATLLKNKVIDIYNEHAAKLDADLEEVATGMTCIVSLKEHYEPMISRGDFTDTEKGIEELRDVHRNLSERIQPRVNRILFEEKHGADGFRNCVKDLGRVVSKPGELPPVKPSEELVEDQSPRCEGECIASPKLKPTIDCDKPGIATQKLKTIQPLLSLTTGQSPVPSDCPSTSFKTEVSVNIRNNLLCTADVEKNSQLKNNQSKETSVKQLEARSGTTDNNPTVCLKETSTKQLQTKSGATDSKPAVYPKNTLMKQSHAKSDALQPTKSGSTDNNPVCPTDTSTKQLQPRSGATDNKPAVCPKDTSTKELHARSDATDCKFDGSVAPNSSKKLLNSTFTVPAVATQGEVKNPSQKITSSATTLVGQPDFSKLQTSVVTGRCTGDGCQSNSEQLPQVTLTLNLDNLRAVSICSENCSLANTTSSVSSIPVHSSALSSSSADSDETISAASELKARRSKAHKSYDEPRLRLELGYETSDMEDASASPSREMSRSDFWLMMSSSVESNLSEHDLIVAELSGEQTSL